MMGTWSIQNEDELVGIVFDSFIVHTPNLRISQREEVQEAFRKKRLIQVNKKTLDSLYKRIISDDGDQSIPEGDSN